MSAHWGRPQCSRAPHNWGFECPPTLETGQGRAGCAPMWESNHITHQAPGANSCRGSHSESVAVCRTPRGQHNTALGIRVRQTRGVPGWPLHSQETAHRPVTHRFQRCARLAVCNPATPNSAVRWRGIRPRSRGGGCQLVALAKRIVSTIDGTRSRVVESHVQPVTISG